ncbi:cytochrome P450 CYP749A22-like [Primulina eburnea]|uniref:cytochrome P450 CYP749A22-like n=1 Tax=Primulina eburnea TaxID=1245227 RepID=UPI003C6C2E28
MAPVEIFVLVLSSVLCLFFLLKVVRFLRRVWWNPIQLQAFMASQGIRGPSYSFPHGSTKEVSDILHRSMEATSSDITHDIFRRTQPHVYTWIKTYGMNFLNWHGSQGQLFVSEPELVKEILMNREGFFPKMDMEGYAKRLLGEALITNEGEKWERIRKLANHTFHSESLKRMVPQMSSSVSMMLENWKNYDGKEIDVFKEFGLLTAEVISRTAFGSSYLEGKNIFEMVAELTSTTVRNVNKIRFPGISLVFKSDDEVEAENLEKRIKGSIMELVKKRESSPNSELGDFGSDYLGQLVKIRHESDVKKRITTEQMIDEIKVIYGAGHLTTTSLLAWCILLLAIHEDWQEKAREEVKETLGFHTPNSDGIARLRTMNLIINECLRLYPPALTLTRKASKKVKLGNLILPRNINIFIPILALHQNPLIWGEDAELFKPERFAEGVAKATKNNSAAFLPFGMGPRTCVGLNFTTNEAKIALSMILQRFKFVISPNYVHQPAEMFILTPKNGVKVILKAL